MEVVSPTGKAPPRDKREDEEKGNGPEAAHGGETANRSYGEPVNPSMTDSPSTADRLTVAQGSRNSAFPFSVSRSAVIRPTNVVPPLRVTVPLGAFTEP